MRRALLFVDHAPAIGGAEQSLLLLLAHLDRAHWSPHLVCTDGRLAESASALDVPVHHIDFPRLRRSPRFAQDLATTAATIADIAQTVDARILHANTVRAAFYTAPAAYIARRPFVWHMRDFWLSESIPAHPELDRLGKHALCTSAAAVIANSHAVAHSLPCPSRVAVVHNGIDTGAFDPTASGAAFRSANAIPAHAPLVGMVGRLRPWKGQQRFLHMAALVAAHHPHVHFVAVGGDPFAVDDGYAAGLLRLRTDLGLDQRVVFTGHLPDVRSALAAVDVFVHPGDPEPFGLVNVEAMAVAKPVVAFAHGALPEIVAHGQTGLLAPPAEVHQLARLVRILLNEPAYAKRLGVAGRQRAVDRFDVRMTTRRVESIYRPLLL